MEEIWKDIEGYEGLYQVSNLGNVKSLTRKIEFSNGRVCTYKEKQLKLRPDRQNRHRVSLSKNSKIKDVMVHTLVAEAFIGERPEGYHICHISGDNQDNRLINIRYDKPSENAIDNYRYGSKCPGGKLTISEVVQIRKLFSTGNYTKKELGLMFGVTGTNIAYITTRKHFNYVNDDGIIQESKTSVI